MYKFLKPTGATKFTQLYKHMLEVTDLIRLLSVAIYYHSEAYFRIFMQDRGEIKQIETIQKVTAEIRREKFILYTVNQLFKN